MNTPSSTATTEEMVTLPKRAAQALLDGLNARIDAACATGVPIFAGIAELHDALARPADSEGVPDGLVERLRCLMAEASPQPWVYRPSKHDDWGWIRGVEKDSAIGRYRPIVANGKDSDADDDAHRAAGTDPYGPNAKLIVEAVNALPVLIAALSARPSPPKVDATDHNADAGKLVAMREACAMAAYRWWDGEPEDAEELRAAVRAVPIPGASATRGAEDTFQERVQPWLMACFGEMIAGDREERNHRFLEESLELVQACGCTAHEAHELVDYVYGRDVGEPAQEVGGVMVTLAALCLANDLDMHANGETELARIWTKVEAIRAKHAAKPKHSPLPQHVRGAEDAQAEMVRQALRPFALAIRDDVPDDQLVEGIAWTAAQHRAARAALGER